MDTAIAIRFLAGRYHATPWDRQVNEAEVEWPPSPWRLLRSFIAVWHRKISPSGDGEEVLESLIERLAARLPHYRLPAATHVHSRHYMPDGSGSKTLVFDAWAAVDPDDELLVVWPGAQLPPEERALLDRIVTHLGFLGRAEGWTEGRLEDWVGDEQATPVSATREPGATDATESNLAGAGVSATGGTATGLRMLPTDCLPSAAADEAMVEESEAIRLPAPVDAVTYREWRAERIREERLEGRKLNKKEQQLLGTLPPRLIDALRLETGDTRAAGWSDPPGSRFEIYRRRGDAFEPRAAGRWAATRGAVDERSRHRAGREGAYPTVIRFALGGRPLPRIEDAIRVGEVMREALMAAVDRRAGSGDRGAGPRSSEVARALALLSGHDLPRGTEHAFLLPEDADGDGFIDHILVHLATGFPPAIVRGAGAIREIWRESDERWPTIAEAVGNPEIFPGHPYLGSATEWVSVTPYLHPWFRKKGFGVEDQIRKECRLRGWGEPELERLESVEVAGKALRPVHFYRFRSRKGAVQPDRQGSFWRVRFPEAVTGPVTLGFGRHWGLGLFTLGWPGRAMGL